VVVIAHRPSALAGTDLVLVMGEGRVQNFGPKEEVLSKVLRSVPASQPSEPRIPTVTPLKVVEDLGVAS
jgi:ABC-type protease/lipase transport system fused ATPase/permease subunit